jgi:outer membrane protein OmpA-like peptidoglycan-associated protein
MNLALARLVGIVAILFISQGATALAVVDFVNIQFQAGKLTHTFVLEDSLMLPLEKSLALLENAAHTLKAYPTIKVRIVGFTDSHECNDTRECKELSRLRAKAVYDWLLAHGVVSTQLPAVEGKGSEEPIGSDDLESGRQYNRRVEIQTL